MADAIILDGHLKSALSAARSLARAGISVRCGAVRSSAPTLHSRICTAQFIYPDPLADLDGFISAINREAIAGSVVYAFSDRTALALSRHRERLASGINILMPDIDVVESVFDKNRLFTIAKELDIPVPDTVTMSEQYPIVIKPRFNCFWRGNSGVLVSTKIAFNAHNTNAAIETLRQSTGEMPMLQRWVPGDEYGVTVLCRAGEILAMSAHHRLRSLSSLGGASTAKETIAVTEAFKGHVECLVRRLSWTGPAMLEFRGDPNGKFVLLEMNGRFWGSLPLAVIAGLNFPLLAFQMAIDSALTEKRQARVGVCSRHMMGDAARILHMKGASCFSAIGDFLRGFFPPFHDDVWEIADPFPWLWDIWDSFIR